MDEVCRVAMSAGPPRGVWGQRAAAPLAVSTGWLVSRMNKVGLDGSICAEYISSLIELHKKSSPGDRDAAIAEFLHDSVPSSSLRSIAEHNRFVEETIGEIRQRLSPATTPGTTGAGVSTKAKGGFKKGTKLSGTALKELVGNVKPSYVQQYSDDEKSAVSVVQPPPPPVRFVSSLSQPELETPQRLLSSGKRRIKAREIGPDEDWEDSITTTPWKTPFESVTPMIEAASIPQPRAVVEREESLPKVVEPLAEAKPQIVEELEPIKTPRVLVEANTPASQVPADHGFQSVLLSPQSLLYSLPTDILSFDFQFEEDEPETAAQPTEAPFDLLKQMFNNTAVASTHSVPEDLPPPGFMDNSKVYSVPFLLSVLKEMKITGGVDMPPVELKGLSKTEVVALPSPVKPRSDSFGWRSHDKVVSNSLTETSQGSWRASGYNNKNGSRRPPQSTEEGFW
ncbi:hypothetical protein C9890_0138 [Perkinsus sp. BL_2016]|nr:hypothetical protein C9890_0138 [Perkinsus sp. BL_2016]